MSIKWLRKNYGTDEKTLSISKSGMYLSSAATHELGYPRHVDIGLQEDHDGSLIAIVIRSTDDESKWSVSYAKQGASGATIGSVRIAQMLKDLNIPRRLIGAADHDLLGSWKTLVFPLEQ